jgi:hypothetical protein
MAGGGRRKVSRMAHDAAPVKLLLRMRGIVDPERDFLQVLRREAWQDLFANLILAECGLVLPKTQAPQPDHNVHDGAYNRGWRTSSAGAASVSRVAMGVLRASQHAEV